MRDSFDSIEPAVFSARAGIGRGIACLLLAAATWGCEGASGGKERAAAASASTPAPTRDAGSGEPERASQSERIRTLEEKATEEADADERVLARLREWIWWNDLEAVERLALGSEVRQSLDELLTTQLLERRTAQRERRAAERDLPEALLAGDLERAERLGAAIAEAERRIEQAELKLRVRGFALLDDTQRRIVAEELPHLAERPWIGSIRRPRVVSGGDDD